MSRTILWICILGLCAIGAACNESTESGYQYTPASTPTTTSAPTTTPNPTSTTTDACEPPDDGIVPGLAHDGYTIVLETPNRVLYDGVVRAVDLLSGSEKPLVADIVVVAGDWLNPKIKVDYSHHYYSWSYEKPEDKPETGYIVGIHAVPTTPALQDKVVALKNWTAVRIWGYEIDRINFNDGHWWTDAGCNTFLITYLCVGAQVIP